MMDVVPVKTTYVNGSIYGRNGSDADAPHLIWRIGTMEPGEEVVLGFRSQINNDAPGGAIIINQAVVDSDQTEPKRAEDSVTVLVAKAVTPLADTGSSPYPYLIIAALVMLAGMTTFAVGLTKGIKETDK
jgi:hypothetical protein